MAEAQQRHDQLQGQLRQSKAQRAAEASAKAQALSQVADLQQQLAGAQRMAEDAAAQFSRDLAAERQSRQQADERAAGESRYLKLQLDEARGATREVKERLQAIEAEKTLAERTMRQQIKSQAERIGALSIETGELRGQLTAVRDERDRAHRRIEDLERRVQSRSAPA